MPADKSRTTLPQRHLSLFAFLLFGAGVAACQNVAQFSSYHAEKRFDFNLSEQTIEATPAWDQYQDNPPLSPRKALEAARDYLKVLFPEGDGWEVSQISLQPVRGRWVYLVGFLEPAPSECKDCLQFPFAIPVTMDGRRSGGHFRLAPSRLRQSGVATPLVSTDPHPPRDLHLTSSTL